MGNFENWKLLRHAKNNISTKIIKENADILADILLASFNDSVEKSNFPSSLKKANIKKGDTDSEDNYRPVSILSNMSEIFERCIFRQLYNLMF